MSHTARRTGATLMYLAGMDIFDIMKVTGHTTPEMLKRYIKADQLDVVQKHTDKYDYFDGWLPLNLVKSETILAQLFVLCRICFTFVSNQCRYAGK